jgi:dienelactone hydrolase
MNMKFPIIGVLVLTGSFIIGSCNNEPEQETKLNQSDTPSVSLKEEFLSFPMDSLTSLSYAVYNENDTNKKPIVLVVHEWWGLTDYPKSRARQLAEQGYLAMAVDMFGNGRLAENPKDAGALATPFYQNPQMTLNRLNAALAKVKSLPQADTSQVVAIGYCFGGGILLNSARLGLDVDGVVSFHGSLTGTPVKKDLLKAKILVCHGAADQFVPEQQVTAFRKSMDSINASYTFKAYPDATHAFTNPDATETGKKFNIPIAYNAAADSASWQDMKGFFNTLFR